MPLRKWMTWIQRFVSVLICLWHDMWWSSPSLNVPLCILGSLFLFQCLLHIQSIHWADCWLPICWLCASFPGVTYLLWSHSFGIALFQICSNNMVGHDRYWIRIPSYFSTCSSNASLSLSVVAKLKRLWSLPRKNLHLVEKKMYVGTQRGWWGGIFVVCWIERSFGKAFVQRLFVPAIPMLCAFFWLWNRDLDLRQWYNMLALKRKKWHCALKTVFSCEFFFLCVSVSLPWPLMLFNP